MVTPFGHAIMNKASRRRSWTDGAMLESSSSTVQTWSSSRARTHFPQGKEWPRSWARLDAGQLVLRDPCASEILSVALARREKPTAPYWLDGEGADWRQAGLQKRGGPTGSPVT